MEVEKSLLVGFFGDSPQVKVMDFFLTYPSFDYSKSQVAEETGVSRITLDKVWATLEREKFIMKTREIGRAEMYRLNSASPRVKALLELDFNVSKAFAEEEMKNHPFLLGKERSGWAPKKKISKQTAFVEPTKIYNAINKHAVKNVVPA